jgi:hypothetical protein
LRHLIVVAAAGAIVAMAMGALRSGPGPGHQRSAARRGAQESHVEACGEEGSAVPRSVAQSGRSASVITAAALWQSRRVENDAADKVAGSRCRALATA